jgi:RNA polymerase sigma factor (sigma-70 family)
VETGELATEDLEALRVPLAGFCYRLLGSSADTDDAVQETLIRASSRRDQYDPSRGRLTTWVHAIATNVCIDMLRSAKRRALVVDLGQATGQGRYVTAFEAHDVEGLKAVLHDDAIASMPPFAWRLGGGEAIAQAVGASDFCAGARLVPCRMNGGRGFGQYRRGDDGVLRPFALVAVQIRGGRIGQIVTFLGTQDRFREFGLPDSLGEREPAPR